MNTSAIVIGVDNTGHMPPLGGAASGAKKFAMWAESQGYKVTLFTDDDGEKVTKNNILDEIRSITESMVCQKLIVFFSGHGFLLGPRSELWLLSESPDPETEAVNVNLSAQFARHSGIPHIIFVSDACRSGGPTHRHRSVTGASIFPNLEPVSDFSEIDFFFATRPGDTALEFNDENEAVTNFKGIFTECLLYALEGNVPEVVKEFEESGNNKSWLIPSHTLRGHLKDIVPQKAQEVDIKLNQRPDVRAESHLPNYFGRLEHPPSTQRSSSSTSRSAKSHKKEVEDYVEQIKNQVMSFRSNEDIDRPAATTDLEKEFDQQMENIVRSRGRDHFETQTGFTVYDRIKSVVAGDNVYLDLFNEGEVSHIRVSVTNPEVGHSILIELESGLGTVLAIMPGFIGTVVLEDGKITTVNYTPSDNTDLYEREYIHFEERIERRRAFVATATRNGMYEMNPNDAEDAADYLRMDKRLDPTLGIYAAYAYSQAGRVDKVRSVLEYMVRDQRAMNIPVPFDVLLLARDRGSNAISAPFCPMLRQGWTLLDLQPETADKLHSYRKLLEPSLWTTFTPEGVELVKTALENGELI